MPVSTQALNELAENIARLRAEESALSLQKKAIAEELEVAEMGMIGLLTEAELNSYPAPAGKCTITYRTSVRTPKTDEAKKAFYDYLRSKGMYDSMVSVNSVKLNSFYKAEMEQAVLEGNTEFQIPGLDEVTMEPNLSFRRA